SEAGSHQRLPGPGAQPRPGELTTTGALNASTCTTPSLAGFRVSSSVFPPASSLVVGADFLPCSPMVVRSEAVASPTLATVTAGSGGQTERAEEGSRVTGAAGGLSAGRALAATTSTATAATTAPARPRLEPCRSPALGARSWGALSARGRLR